MRSQHISMTVEEYQALPRRLGWKCEYWDGQAHLTPADVAAVVSVPVEPRAVAAPCVVRPVSEDDAPALMDAFEEAFTETAEYCDWPADSVRKSARECVERVLFGRPSPASRLAEAGGEVAGAALVSETPAGPLLDILLVRPAWQRRGVATALVSAATNALHAAGETRLFSSYHLANEESIAWHQRFGFVEEPDLMLAERRHRLVRWELARRETLGDLTPADRAALEAECAHWDATITELEELQFREGRQAVAPFLRLRG